MIQHNEENYIKHYNLEKRLILGRLNNDLSEEEEDRILDEMELLWYGLTNRQRKFCNERADMWHKSKMSVQDFNIIYNIE